MQIHWSKTKVSPYLLIGILVICELFFVFAPNASAQVTCDSWGGIQGWQGTAELKGSGSGSIGKTTYTVSYSSSTPVSMPIPKGLHCPAPLLDWVNSGSATVTINFKSVTDCGPIEPPDIVTVSATAVPGTTPQSLSTDFSKQSYTFLLSPLANLVTYNESNFSCAGGPKQDKLPFPAGPILSGLPSFTLPVKPGTLSETKPFQAMDEFSHILLDWTIHFELTPVCAVPSGETTAFDGWVGPTGTWKQTLKSSAGFTFDELTVKETDGAPGTDSCWFPGSAIAKSTGVTGGPPWTVRPDNTWGDDFVGWLPDGVVYYRAQKRAPCGATAFQQMELVCFDGKTQKYGNVNTLRGVIGSKPVQSGRAGVVKTRNWP